MEQITYICLLTIALFELMQIASAQYPFVEAHKEIQIGFPEIRNSRSKVQILYFTDVDAMVYYPNIRNCDDFFFLHMQRGAFSSIKTEIIGYRVCIYAGQYRFILRYLGLLTKDNFEFALFMKKPIMLNEWRIGHFSAYTPRYYSVLAFHANRSLKLPMVPWHYVAGTGPGWIDLRFSVPHTHPRTLCTYRIRHWRHTDGKDPQYVYEPTVPNMYIDFKEIMPRVKPPLPCPQWKTYDIYCVLLTAHIGPLHFSGMDFSDYVVHITTVGIGQACYNIQNYTYNLIDTELWGRESDPVTFVVRVWEKYDTTSGEGPKLLRSLPFHHEWRKEPILKEFWGKNLSEESYEDTTGVSTTTHRHQFNDSSAQYSEMFTMDETLGQYKTLWPFLLFFVLLLLLIVLPLIMFANKRTCVSKEMSKWEHWKSADEDVVFAARRPVPAPRLDPA